MSDAEEPDDEVSRFNNLRKRIEGAFRPSSSPSTDEKKDELPEIPEQADSTAIEEYLASRLQQIGEVAPETHGTKGLRTGNGWDANQIIEQVYKIEPIPTRRAVEIAVSSNRQLRERMANRLLHRKHEMRLIDEPTVEFVPVWRIRGFHECYYLRTNTYKVNVKEDVVGVEVEGKTRDLILERKHRKFIPTAIVERLQRLSGFLSGESKYFLVSNVTELARIRSESEVVITWKGKKLSLDDELLLTSWRPKRIFDESDLKARGANVRVRESAISKEAVVERFREQVIRMPDRFKQILSSRLQVTEFRRIYIPLIRVSFQKGLVPHEVIVNGSGGQVADKSTLEILT